MAGYRVYRNSVRVAQVTSTSYTDSGLSDGTTYSYYVVAYDTSGYASGASNTVSAAPSDTTSPTTPSGLTTSAVSASGATLNWTASTDNVGVAGYNVYLNGTKQGTATGTSGSFTGLSCGTSYTLGVIAYDSARNTSAVASTSATTSACSTSSGAPANTTAPAISGTAQQGSTLSSNTGSWTGSPSSYTYGWKDCDSSGNNCTEIAGASASSYTLASGDVNHTIRVVVTATNVGGSASQASAPSQIVSGSGGFSCPIGVRCFYIDYASGSDSNSGTSETAPWKRAPGMHGFTGTYSHQAGDEFIFKGGVSWPNSAFPLVTTGSGNATHDDYYGVDPSWYAGRGFMRPIFDAGGANITGSGEDVFFDLRGQDYIEIDDIQMNFYALGLSSAYGTCAGVEMVGDQHITINRIYMPNMYEDLTSYNGPHCYAVMAATYAPFAGSSIVENSTFTSAPNSYAEGIWSVGNIENNTIDGLAGEAYPLGTGQVSGNLLENCGANVPTAGIHENAIEVNVGGETLYIHDNVIRNTSFSPSGCEAMYIGGNAVPDTDYVYNNVLYNIHGDGLNVDLASGNHLYYYNNSVEGGIDGRSYCLRSGHNNSGGGTIVFENNLCVTTGSTVAPTIGATISKNVLVTPANLASNDLADMTATYPFQPSAGAPTYGAGADLTASCTSLTALCLTTSFAQQLAPSSRPASGAWDAGAYE